MSECISVVVPTCRRPALLARCLEALLEQDLAPENYEILIIDDANCRETKHLVEGRARCAALHGQCVRYIPMECAHRHGPAVARNTGWRAARGEIIAFTDDDCIPAHDWLRAGMAALRDGIDGVAGLLIVPLPEMPTDYERNAAGIAGCAFVTANCFYRRAALASIGGFDERFTAAWREDSDLVFTLEEQNARLIPASDAVVVHPVRPERWGISLFQQRKSMYNALLYKKHPALYRQKIQASAPWRYYGNVGALLLVLVGALRRSGLFTLTGLMLWTYLTGRFCAQRLQNTSHAPGHIAEMAVTSAIIPPLAIFWRLRGALKFRVFFL